MLTSASIDSLSSRIAIERLLDYLHLLPIKGLLEPLETMRLPWPTPNNFLTSSRASRL